MDRVPRSGTRIVYMDRVSRSDTRIVVVDRVSCSDTRIIKRMNLVVEYGVEA